jgi:hypothetical protein
MPGQLDNRECNEYQEMELLCANSLLLNELLAKKLYQIMTLKFPQYFFMRMNFAAG